MVATTFHVFGVPPHFDSKVVIEKILTHIGKNSKDITLTFYDPKRECLKLEFEDLKENDLRHLKSIGQKITINNATMPIVINGEVFSETEVQFSHELYQLLFARQSESKELLYPNNIFENLKVTRRSEDEPWTLRGTVSNLYNFQEKVNKSLSLKSVCTKTSVACATEPSESSVNASLTQSSNDVIPKTTPSVIRSNNGEPDKVMASQPSGLRDETKLCLQIGNNLKISVYIADITKEEVSAIVNPVYECKETNNHLKRTCAQALQQQMVKTPYKVGYVNYYVANGLGCDRVIDVNLPSYEGSLKDAEKKLAPLLQECYANCLSEAKYLEVKSIAFQPLACELFEGAAKISAHAATLAVLSFIQRDNLGPIKDIRFIVSDDSVVRIFVKSFFDLMSALNRHVDVEIVSNGDDINTSKQRDNVTPDGEPSTSTGRRKFDSNSSDERPVPKKISSADADSELDKSEDMEWAASENNLKNETAAASIASTAHVEECSICLTELGVGEGIKELPKCQHKFHIICIETWLQEKNSCPLCQTRFGVPKGNQPEGSMSIRVVNSRAGVPGFRDSKGYIEIHYTIPGGIQGVNCF